MYNQNIFLSLVQATPVYMYKYYFYTQPPTFNPSFWLDFTVYVQLHTFYTNHCQQ